MITANNLDKCKSAICKILIVLLIFSRMIFPNDFSHLISEVSDSIPANSIIKSDLSDISHEVFARENTISSQVSELIRVNTGKITGYERTVIKLCVLGILLALFALFSSLKSMHFNLCIERVKQRLSIIIYIHDSDGRKRLLLA